MYLTLQLGITMGSQDFLQGGVSQSVFGWKHVEMFNSAMKKNWLFGV